MSKPVTEIDKKHKRKISNAKAKGREFCKRLRDRFIEVFDLDPEEVRIAVGYEQGTDLKFSKKAQKKVGLYIEAKNCKDISLGSWLKQTLNNTPKGGVPALIYHKPVMGNKMVWVTIPLEHYFVVRQALLLYEEEKDDQN